MPTTDKKRAVEAYRGLRVRLTDYGKEYYDHRGGEEAGTVMDKVSARGDIIRVRRDGLKYGQTYHAAAWETEEDGDPIGPQDDRAGGHLPF